MSLLWVTAVHDPMHWARRWADEYQMSPVAHPDVLGIIRQFPPDGSNNEMYSKLMNNVAHHHAQEWFKDDPEGLHEPTHHMTQNYLDAHNGTSEIEGLL